MFRRSLLTIIAFVVISLGPLFLVSSVSAIQAFPAGTPCNGFDLADTGVKGKTFFGLPAWYKYVKDWEHDGYGNCTPDVQFPEGIWQIGLALLDILLRLAGMLAVVFVMYAGVVYITSRGNPEKIVGARTRIINALIGLGIAIVAVGVVQFIGNTII